MVVKETISDGRKSLIPSVVTGFVATDEKNGRPQGIKRIERPDGSAAGIPRTVCTRDLRFRPRLFYLASDVLPLPHAGSFAGRDVRAPTHLIESYLSSPVVSNSAIKRFPTRRSNGALVCQK